MCMLHVFDAVSLLLPLTAGITELEDDEGLVDQAIAGGAFQFLRQCVVASPYFHQEVCVCVCLCLC